MTKRFSGVLCALLLAGAALGACGSAQKSSDPETANIVTEPDPEPPAPEAKLTEAQCTEAVDRAIVLIEADEQAKGYAQQMKDNHAQFVGDCVQTGTQADYDCLMAAKDFQELGKCEDPGAR